MKISSDFYNNVQADNNSILLWIKEKTFNMATIIINRLPVECSYNTTHTYEILFTQYNILVLLIIFSVYCIFSLFTSISILNYIKLTKSNSKGFLGKVANSWITNYIIIIISINIYIHIIVISISVYFIFTNYLSPYHANILDITLQNFTINL